MAKARWRRTWVKMWVNECLEGSIRFDFSPAERGVWYDLILLAGRCRVPGIISANQSTPYPNSYIAGLLNISIDLLEATLKKCETSGRIRKIDAGFELINWEHYQSEFQRQKPYRDAKKSGKKIHRLCPTCGYKGFTDEEYCPECAKKNQGVKLEKDYKAGKYGHMIKD